MVLAFVLRLELAYPYSELPCAAPGDAGPYCLDTARWDMGAYVVTVTFLTPAAD